ncbi:hypothetical protein HYR54_02100 [Candidatus Acetothermia bacterium]|nr:hypothetical protein [Candidatus Acetothermia bacterium]MBI3459534.1 hypothetical protein [Candidatus Acetothermia bacterium]
MHLLRWLTLVVIVALFVGAILALWYQNANIWIGVASGVSSLVIGGASLWFNVGSRRMDMLRRQGKAELDIRIERPIPGERSYVSLVTENKGYEALVGEMRVYIEPEDPLHRNMWLFDPEKFVDKETMLKFLKGRVPVEEWKLRLRPKESQRYAYTVTEYVTVLAKLGYHQLSPHQTVLEGWYQSTVLPDAPKETFVESYRVIWLVGKNDWLVIRQSIEVKYNTDQLQKRENISEELELENDHKYFR